jgi:predicted permease
VLQVGVSCALLMAAALFVRSLHNLIAVDPGFVRDKLLIASIDPRLIGYTEDKAKLLYARLLEEARRIPGVISAALADCAPLGNHTGNDLFFPDYISKPNEPRDSPSATVISPGYFATMNIPIVLGRDLDHRDGKGPTKVILINETFARHYYGGSNPVGKRVGFGNGIYDVEIIGVVKDGKYGGLKEGPVRMFYSPYEQRHLWSNMVLHMRIAASPESVATALRAKVQELDKSLPLFEVRTVENVIEASLSTERLIGTITVLFGVLALILASIGLYGVMAYRVSQRTREFGIRMAIGAGAGTVTALVLRQAAILVAAGVLLGAGVTWAMGRVIRGMLFGLQPNDPWSLIAAVSLLAAAAILAAWVPARRASRVDPVRALRFQ